MVYLSLTLKDHQQAESCKRKIYEKLLAQLCEALDASDLED